MMFKRIGQITMHGLLLVVLLGSTGCVYWRLLKLKGELSEFQKNFRMEDRAVPVIVFNEPVLKVGDLTWLTGFEVPGEQDAGIQREQYVFERVLDRDRPMIQQPLELAVLYTNGLMFEYHFPERLKPILTEQTFVEIFTPLAEALINKDSEAAEWAWGQLSIPIPAYSNVVNVLGPPDDFTTNAIHHEATFRYELMNAVEGSLTDFIMRYTFWNYNGRVALAEVQFGRLWLSLDISTKKSRIRMQRVSFQEAQDASLPASSL